MLMHSSIVSCFRGALLGAALGESLGAHCQTRKDSGRAWTDAECWAFQPLSVDSSRAMLSIIQQLLDSSSENIVVEGSSGDDQADLISLLPAMLLGFDQIQPGSEGTAFGMSRFISKTLSMDGHLLQQAIALTLTGCPPHRLIEQLVSFLQALSTPEVPLVVNQLWQVQTLVESGQGLMLASPLRSKIAQQQFEHQTSDPTASMLMPIALYSFLCTPEDGRVALLRTAQLGHQPQITCALTGALVGAWSGVSAMPIAWRRCFGSSQAPSALSSLWQVSSEAALFKLADQLAAAWAGVYLPTGDRAIAPEFPARASLPHHRWVATR